MENEWSIQAERKQSEAFALRQLFFEDIHHEYFAEIFRKLIQLNDAKIALLEEFQREMHAIFEAVKNPPSKKVIPK